MNEVYASVDLGGTNIKCVLATADGAVRCSKSIPTDGHEDPVRVLGRMAALVNESSAQIGAKPAALGMGVPGLADLKNGVTKFLPNLPAHWRDAPVRDILSPKVGCPVYLLNDVRMATLGELTYGHGRTVSTMVFYALGTGVGGGVVVDGRLRLGPWGAAGELGHMTVAPDGPLCGCGNRGCIEPLASGPAIAAEGVRLLLSNLAPKLRELTSGDVARVTTKAMAEAAAAGDENVRDAIVRAARYLGIGVANTVAALFPELVVLGGGVAQIGDLLFDTVRQTLAERVRMFPIETVAVRPSLLGDMAGALGGIALAVKQGRIGE